MKQLQIFATTLAFGGILLLFSACNSAGDKKGTDAVVNTDSSTVPKTEVPTKPASLMIIKHKVTDFDKWLTGFEAHDSMRKVYGLHSYGVSRGVDDKNMVMVALKIDDINRAKEFAALPDLKTAMQKSGVVGDPSIMYFDRQVLFLSNNDPSMRVMISHTVKDWDAWKKEFDNHKQARTDAGLTDRAVGYELGNNKTAIIVDVVSNLAKAREFFNSKDLKDRMQVAGVNGAPELFFYNLIKTYK